MMDISKKRIRDLKFANIMHVPYTVRNDDSGLDFNQLLLNTCNCTTSYKPFRDALKKSSKLNPWTTTI